jgi:hypothetical protein
MTYSDFTLAQVCKTFALELRRSPLFAGVSAVAVSSWLSDWLGRSLPFAFGSEKARSEFLVVPILMASIERNNHALSIYSGQRLDVAPDQGLAGECDFLLTRTPPLPILQAPVVALVEAKKHDIEAGFGQCAAQMVGARLFNEREGHPIPRIFGCVTTGEIWQFLNLEADTLTVDHARYYLDNLELLLGVLDALIQAVLATP